MAGSGSRSQDGDVSAYETDDRLSVGVLHELGRLASPPLREVGRLEHEDASGESAATPAIRLAGIAAPAAR